MANTNIFNRGGSKFGGAVSADACQFTFTGGHAGLLTQNMQIRATRDVSRLWEIGSNYTYYVGGRAAGTFGLARIVGPVPLSKAFFDRFTDVCRAEDNVINISGVVGCSPTDGLRGAYDAALANVVIVDFGINISMNDMVLNQNISGMFNSLKWDESS